MQDFAAKYAKILDICKKFSLNLEVSSNFLIFAQQINKYDNA